MTHSFPVERRYITIYNHMKQSYPWLSCRPRPLWCHELPPPSCQPRRLVPGRRCILDRPSIPVKHDRPLLIHKFQRTRNPKIFDFSGTFFFYSDAKDRDMFVSSKTNRIPNFSAFFLTLGAGRFELGGIFVRLEGERIHRDTVVRVVQGQSAIG